MLTQKFNWRIYFIIIQNKMIFDFKINLLLQRHISYQDLTKNVRYTHNNKIAKHINLDMNMS